MTDEPLHITLYRTYRRRDIVSNSRSWLFACKGAHASVSLSDAKSAADRYTNPEWLKRNEEARRARKGHVNVPRYAPRVWAVSDAASLGAAFKSGAFNLRWCENPPFRYVGLAHDFAKLRHTGWFVDGFQGELARGVVYQMKPNNGRARFIPAICDPSNSEADGTGPAMLALEDICEADDASEEASEEARREAARLADQAAEMYAEQQRAWNEAYEAGREWREAASLAHKAGRALVRELRAACNAFLTRKARALVGITRAETLAAFREARSRISSLREEYADAVDARQEARLTALGVYREYRPAALEGYANY